MQQSVVFSSMISPVALPPPCRATEPQIAKSPNIYEIEDTDTYSSVVYVPPNKKIDSLPLIVLLHGAGNNQHSALYEFTNFGSSSPPGDHTQLPLALLSKNQAPSSLADNFVVVAPYVGKGKQGSLYDEPRTKILAFIKWVCRFMEEEYSLSINRQKISLFGFSEGATLAVELATTHLFNAVVLASYGFTGILPKLALERLRGVPMWVFHSTEDDVYSIECSKRLIENLITNYQGDTDVFDVREIVKFTKLKPLERTNDGSSDLGREHIRSALIASRSSEVFEWLLRQ